MWCSNCPNFDTCEDPAKLGGGCDIDGADDFGVDPVEDVFNVSELSIKDVGVAVVGFNNKITTYTIKRFDEED